MVCCSHFCLVSYTKLNEDVDEWEPVDWDIIAEDEEMNDHYSWVFSKLKKDEESMIKNDPFTNLF